MNSLEAPRWRAMTRSDLAGVTALATRIHPNFPERPEVLSEKFALFPAGCFVIADANAIHGYCFSHPWAGAPPSLDTFLDALPLAPESYFIHDLTLDDTMRRRNFAAQLVPQLMRVARDANVFRMTLVAVNGSAPFWSRMGFRRTADEAMQEAARSKYDAGSLHMEQHLT
jgi:hypothetical protein